MSTDQPSAKRATVVAVVTLKGGESKTTLSWNLACRYAQSGLKVLAIDADQQASFSDFALTRKRVNPNAPALFETRAANKALFRELPDLLTNYDLVVIDGPPQLGPVTSDILMASDYALLPCAPAAINRAACQQTLDLAGHVAEKRDIGIGILPVVRSPLTKRARAELDAFKYFKITVHGEDHAPTIHNSRLTHSDDFNAVQLTGLGVSEISSSKPSAVMLRQIADELRQNAAF